MVLSARGNGKVTAQKIWVEKMLAQGLRVALVTPFGIESRKKFKHLVSISLKPYDKT